MKETERAKWKSGIGAYEMRVHVSSARNVDDAKCTYTEIDSSRMLSPHVAVSLQRYARICNEEGRIDISDLSLKKKKVICYE